MDRRLSPRYFDNELPLVSTRHQEVDGKTCEPGGLIAADLEHRIRLKLWMSGRAKYQKDYSPVPQEAAVPDLAAPIEIKEVGSNGYYELHAPWLDEPIRVRGKVKAEKAMAELQKGGEPASYKGVTISGPNDGLYEISADWINIPFSRSDEEAAKALATRLRAQGPFADDLEGVAAVAVENGVFVIVTPWGSEYETFEGTDEEASAYAATIRAAADPSAIPGDQDGDPESGDATDETPADDADQSDENSDPSSDEPDSPETPGE